MGSETGKEESSVLLETLECGIEHALDLSCSVALQFPLVEGCSWGITPWHFRSTPSWPKQNLGTREGSDQIILLATRATVLVEVGSEVGISRYGESWAIGEEHGQYLLEAKTESVSNPTVTAGPPLTFIAWRGNMTFTTSLVQSSPSTPSLTLFPVHLWMDGRAMARGWHLSLNGSYSAAAIIWAVCSN